MCRNVFSPGPGSFLHGERGRIRRAFPRHTQYAATGVGAYIAKWTETGDFPRIALGITVLSLYVLLCNRLLWRRLYALAEERLRLD